MLCKNVSYLHLYVEATLESENTLDADLPYLMHVLSDMEGLPPGGGLSSK